MNTNAYLIIYAHFDGVVFYLISTYCLHISDYSKMSS